MMKKVGLALGGGGARGFSHLGVVQALHEFGIPIHCIAGTSMGAIVGGIVAAGAEAAADRWAREPDWKKLPKLFFDLNLSKQGLVSGRQIEKFLRKMIPVSTFDELKLPFAAVATDYNTGEEVAFTSGDVISAIRASMSIPGIFRPVTRDGRILVDGGLVNPVPVNICRQLGAEVVIAVDINVYRPNVRQKGVEDINLIDALDMMFALCSDRITQANERECPSDLLLRPHLQNIKLLDFRNASTIVAQGYNYAILHKKDIFQVVEG